MRVWTLWYGGSSYANPTEEDIEEYDTIAQARSVFECRYEGDGGYTPCVDDTSVMLLFSKPPVPGPEDWDPYPFAEFAFGPRGGVRYSRC